MAAVPDLESGERKLVQVRLLLLAQKNLHNLHNSHKNIVL